MDDLEAITERAESLRNLWNKYTPSPDREVQNDRRFFFSLLGSLLTELRRVKEQLASDTPGQCRDCPGGKSWEDEAARLRKENERLTRLTDYLRNGEVNIDEQEREYIRLREALEGVATYRGTDADVAREDRDADWRLIALRLEDIARNALQPQTESGYMPGWQDPLGHVRGWPVKDNKLEDNRQPTQTEKGETDADASRGA